MTFHRLALVALTVMAIGGCTSATPSPSPSIAASVATPTVAAPSQVPTVSASPSPTPSAAPSIAADPSASTGSSAIPRSSPVDGAIWVPGTHVSMVPPPGLDPMTTNAGFRDPSSTTTIQIVELPGGPFDRTAAGFAQAGFVVDDRDQTTDGGQTRILTQGEQTLPDGSRVGAILLSLGTPAMSTLVIAQHELGDDDARASILEALDTVRLDPARVIEPGFAIAFDMTPAPPLELAGMLGQGATYSPLGRMQHPLDAAIPTLNAYLYPGTPPADPAAFLREQLDRNGQQLFQPVVESEGGVVIDGQDGYEIVASAQDALQLPERRLVVYQGFVPGPDRDRYAYLSGIALEEVKDELLPAFRDTARSLQWRDVPSTPIPTPGP